ncbi:hypothetical protein [Pseudomonas sp. Irchel 3E20]|uniref:hypothetical protein n=1 Tax=Pseudomonas sp. Irchel 3E20 TaxID=2008983 RepID=UPI000BA342A3|nr:hypothetical protein [Pseudomonas sp. Irchel 3E20]
MCPSGVNLFLNALASNGAHYKRPSKETASEFKKVLQTQLSTSPPLKAEHNKAAPKAVNAPSPLLATQQTPEYLASKKQYETTEKPFEHLHKSPKV